MSRTWFIADTHFGHKNIITYENRPFADTIEMNNTLIKNWNSVVAKDDIVWFLGDLALGNREEARALVSKLSGNKRMVRGNHDNWTDEFYRSIGFQFVSRYPIILKNHFVLSHSPLETMKLTNSFFFIYGHVHSHPAYESKTENSCCVSVERWNYTPIRIEEFDNYVKEQVETINR